MKNKAQIIDALVGLLKPRCKAAEKSLRVHCKKESTQFLAQRLEQLKSK